MLAAAAEQGLPAVVDADGLGYLPKPAPASWLLTPHAGELARLLGRERSWVEEDPVRAVTDAARQTGATVLLKGATQLVAAPDDRPVLVAVPGPAWTAQAGSGDVLGGVCAALLAAGVNCPTSRSARGLGSGGRRSRTSWCAGATRAGTRHRRDTGSVWNDGRGTSDQSGAAAGCEAPASTQQPRCAEIDLAAFRSNVAALRRHADVPVMIVVKADGYGHGMLECAREARAAGAEWLGVATPAEALQLREAGDSGPTLGVAVRRR